jgi:UDP-N-acetylglucosamine--N-acetylmuramyl-(pentapeptide) pyrophosphoryl-undecaprenol N-acetylglucosamine transferase
MHSCYAATDLVICRAGAMTLTEISAWAKPSILVPFPHSAEDHQRKNARVFEQNGASIYIDDNDLSSQILKESIETIIDNDEKLNAMSESAREFAHPNALDDIIDDILHTLENENGDSK